MELYYDKSELENDKTYQFIRDLDLPAEPNDKEEESHYKRSNTCIKDTERKRARRSKTDQARATYQSINTALLVSNRSKSPEYCNVDTDENLAISQYSRLGRICNYSDTSELLSISRYNQQPVRNSDSTETLSQCDQLNPRVYSSDNSGELLAVSQNNMGDIRTFNSVDTGNNLVTSQYSLCDVQGYESYTNNKLKAVMTPKLNQAVSAVWDVIDPLGKVRGLPASVPEIPIFSTGIVTPNTDSTQSLVSSKTDSYQKPVIRYSQFVLYCPRKCDVTKPEVDRPSGCKTLVISGIPEKMKEGMVRDVFRKCGKIVKIRMRKCGCYITFASTSDVDRALKLSGYQVVIRDRHESPYCGKIHVDFVPVREEELQYERAKQKERDAMKDHGPIRPLLPHFSEAAATLIVDQLRNKDSLDEGVKLLVKWMEEGNCNRNNASSFFSILQAMQGFVSRLMKDTAKVEEEARQHQYKLKGKYAANSLHFVAILKAFDIATSQNVWDHFSKTQRSRIGVWKKHIEEIKASNSQDLILGRVEEMMNLSDDKNSSVSQQGEELKRLQEENAHLKSELSSVKNEGLKKEPNNVLLNCCEVKTNEKFQTGINGRSNNHASSDNVKITPKEARLIALVGAFLNFHRFGECINSISKFVLKIDSSFTIKDIQSLLRKFPTVFKESFQEKKWTFLGV